MKKAFKIFPEIKEQILKRVKEEVDIASVKDFWLLLQKILEDFNPLVQVQ